jgi:hypothetical protein
MLVVDPMKRITIREIREHQWFQIRLPRYLAVPPPDTSQQAKMVRAARCMYLPLVQGLGKVSVRNNRWVY